MNGLTFNGINSNTLGLAMISKNRPILPEPKLVTESLPCMDGEYDFSDSNPAGRTVYNPITIEVEFGFRGSKMPDVRARARQIAQWLRCGEQKLIFDDEPDKYFLGRVINKLDLENTMTSAKRFTVQFKCKPFSFGLDVVTQEWEILTEQIINITNSGSFPCKPILKVSGYLTSLDIVCGESVFSITEPVNNAAITIDFEKYLALSAMENKLSVISGSFFELQPGDNELQITGNGLNFILEIKYRPVYV